ncbi:cold-shock protein [Parapedobacter sp.]
MAETFSKRERRKKKIERRREKEFRRDERRQMPVKQKSLEEMMAYVDENGNLSDTPPDPKNAYKVAAEDIVIDIPKALPDDPDATPTGVVSYFDPSKGYGFIVNDQTHERLFVHVNSFAEPTTELSIGDKVSYTPIRSPRGMQATTVVKI